MQEKHTNDNPSSIIWANVSFILLLISIGIVCVGFVGSLIERIFGVGNFFSELIRPFIEIAGCFFPVVLVFSSVFGLISFIGLLKSQQKAKKPYVYALTSFIIGLTVIWTIAIILILESITTSFMFQSGNIDIGDVKINITPMMKVRHDYLKRLEESYNNLLYEVKLNGITGVSVDTYVTGLINNMQDEVYIVYE